MTMFMSGRAAVRAGRAGLAVVFLAGALACGSGAVVEPIPGRATVVGVVSGADGRPIANAAVAVAPLNVLAVDQADPCQAAVTRPDSTLLVSGRGTTDANGRYRIELTERRASAVCATVLVDVGAGAAKRSARVERVAIRLPAAVTPSTADSVRIDVRVP